MLYHCNLDDSITWIPSHSTRFPFPRLHHSLRVPTQSGRENSTQFQFLIATSPTLYCQTRPDTDWPNQRPLFHINQSVRSFCESRLIRGIQYPQNRLQPAAVAIRVQTPHVGNIYLWMISWRKNNIGAITIDQGCSILDSPKALNSEELSNPTTSVSKPQHRISSRHDGPKQQSSKAQNPQCWYVRSSSSCSHKNNFTTFLRTRR